MERRFASLRASRDQDQSNGTAAARKSRIGGGTMSTATRSNPGCGRAECVTDADAQDQLVTGG